LKQCKTENIAPSSQPGGLIIAKNKEGVSETLFFFFTSEPFPHPLPLNIKGRGVIFLSTIICALPLLFKGRACPASGGG